MLRAIAARAVRASGPHADGGAIAHVSSRAIVSFRAARPSVPPAAHLFPNPTPSVLSRLLLARTFRGTAARSARHQAPSRAAGTGRSRIAGYKGADAVSAASLAMVQELEPGSDTSTRSARALQRLARADLFHDVQPIRSSVRDFPTSHPSADSIKHVVRSTVGRCAGKGTSRVSRGSRHSAEMEALIQLFESSKDVAGLEFTCRCVFSADLQYPPLLSALVSVYNQLPPAEHEAGAVALLRFAADNDVSLTSRIVEALVKPYMRSGDPEGICRIANACARIDASKGKAWDIVVVWIVLCRAAHRAKDYRRVVDLLGLMEQGRVSPCGSLISVVIALLSQNGLREELARATALAHTSTAQRGRMGEAVQGALLDVHAEQGDLQAVMTAVRTAASSGTDVSRTLMQKFVHAVSRVGTPDDMEEVLDLLRASGATEVSAHWVDPVVRTYLRAGRSNAMRGAFRALVRRGWFSTVEEFHAYANVAVHRSRGGHTLTTFLNEVAASAYRLHPDTYARVLDGVRETVHATYAKGRRDMPLPCFPLLMELFARRGDAAGARAVLEDMYNYGPPVGVAEHNILLAMYARKGDEAGMREVLREMGKEGVQPDTNSINQLLRLFHSKRDLGGAERALAMMDAMAVPPDAITFTIALRTALDAGDVRKARQWADQMSALPSVKPTPASEQVLVELLAAESAAAAKPPNRSR